LLEALKGEFAVHRLSVFVAIMILACNPGHAQTRNRLLRGLSEVQLVIEELSKDAKPCG
jgi:hypothetical protein